ncbi:hypothetical protein ACWJOD_23215, partial [Escherichia coli]
PVKTTPLFAVGYQKPQQTHDVQPVKQPRCSQSDTSSLISLPMRSKLNPMFAVGYQKPLQTHDVQHVITIPCSQSDTSILIRPLMRSKLNPLSLSSFGYLKSLQATDV